MSNESNETQKQTKRIEIHQSQTMTWTRSSHMCFLGGPLRWLMEQKNPKILRIIIRWYTDLARAKSEALDNVYSLFKENIKSCNAKRRRQRRRMVKNNNRSNSKKSNFARAVHFFRTFLCRCFARLQRETSRNILGPVYMEWGTPV